MLLNLRVTTTGWSIRPRRNGLGFTGVNDIFVVHAVEDLDREAGKRVDIVKPISRDMSGNWQDGLYLGHFEPVLGVSVVVLES